jgi:hypothetical protein
VRASRGSIHTVAALALACGAGLTGCAERAPSDITDAKLSASRFATGTASERVTLAVASAMRTADGRALIRDAWRASVVSEHKLVLQLFADTPEGQRFFAAGARAAGIAPAKLADDIAALPMLDLYVPRFSQRTTWHGDRNVVVATRLDPHDKSALYGATPDGDSALVATTTWVGNAVGVVMEPVEFKAQREQILTPADPTLIQDPAESDVSISVTVTGPGLGGPSRMVVCGADCAGGGGGSPPPPPPGPQPTLTLVSLETLNLADGAEDQSEFEVRTIAYYGNNVELRRQTVAFSGINVTDIAQLNKIVMQPVPAQTTYLVTHFFEMDGSLGAEYTFYNDPIVPRAVSSDGAMYHSGHARCGYPYYPSYNVNGYNHFCPDYPGNEFSGLGQDWRELNTIFSNADR